MTQKSVTIVLAQRTPTGALQGQFQSHSAPQLASYAIHDIVQKSHLNPDLIDEVVMGCVLPAGIGQAPARQAALAANLPRHVACMTVNKVCGSGLQSVMIADDQIKSGTSHIIIAGGMESMTNAPYLLPSVRKGWRMGHQQAIDHMQFDGLQDSFSGGTLMGVFAEKTAERYAITRSAQDEFAINSAKKAHQAQESGHFKAEITPVPVQAKSDGMLVLQDEPPSKVKFDKIPQLKPAFQKDGTITAASSSSIADGAAAVLVMAESTAEKHHLKPLARIVAHASHSREPEWFTLAPIGAIKKVLDKAHWSIKDVDLFEINEAFAVVTMAAMADLEIPADKVNIHGGACALGHPIGASGARILVTLVHALAAHNKKRGIAALCIGGGEGVAMAIERLD